jgi:hypothetical protein
MSQFKPLTALLATLVLLAGMTLPSLKAAHRGTGLAGARGQQLRLGCSCWGCGGGSKSKGQESKGKGVESYESHGYQWGRGGR